MVPLSVNGVSFVGGVHKRIADLLQMLLEECAARGYVFHSGQCWGFAGRFTKRPDGSQTKTPSNHSWGLAVDVNSLINPYGGTHHNFPQWMLDLMHEYGFRWLGPAINDQEHFDFCGTPIDADNMTAKAEQEGLGNMTPAQQADLTRAANFVDELIKKLKAANAVGAADRTAAAVLEVEKGPQPAPAHPHTHSTPAGTTGSAA
jgi:hypothetical protein